MALQKASPQTPAVVVAGATPSPLFPNYSVKPAFWILVEVLDMKTSAWAYIGDKTVQADGLFSKTDFTLYDVPDGYWFDASQYYAISQNGDAVLGVIGMYPAQV